MNKHDLNLKIVELDTKKDLLVSQIEKLQLELSQLKAETNTLMGEFLKIGVSNVSQD